MIDYEAFITKKSTQALHAASLQVSLDELNPKLYRFQKDIVRWALAKGRAAVFADCGLGKTPMQLEWAHQIIKAHGGMVLILAPLAVSSQTAAEGVKFGVPVTICQSAEDLRPGVNITNYERLDKFAGQTFSGVVLDESSILKSFDGKVRNQIIDFFSKTPFRLACTATPAPNDYMELGNHAEFLGIMSYTEMLAMFFVHDGGQTSKWRLKGHAEDVFWQWMGSGWAAGRSLWAARTIWATVTLFHYLGEVDRKASYEAFVLKNVRLEESRATGNGTAGKTPADTATLYILDRYASSREWGLSDDGRDMFCPGEVQKPEDAGTLYRVSAVLRRKAARSRLNHWEVLGNADRRSV